MATKRAVANSIKAAWNWAVDEERIDRSPFRRVRYTDADPRPAMPDDVFQEICELANKRFERAVRFLRLTGCRTGELCALAWPDLDLDRGVCVIQRHKSFRYTHRPKTIMLVPAAIEMLRCLKALQPAGYDGIIFLTTRNTPWNRQMLSRQLRRMKTRYGIATPASLHGLRHAFAQTAANAGAPMKMISLQLGHASAAFTEKRYAGVGYAAENIRAAAALGQPASDS